jgi:RNA polymerase sigma factor (TIGR02999 family)
MVHRPEIASADQLFTAHYQQLHRLGKRQLARSGGARSLGPTTLVHEVYLDISARPAARFPDRGHFLAYAVRSMRGIIVDALRGLQAKKRGGGVPGAPLDADRIPDRAGSDPARITIQEALADLAHQEPALARVVRDRFFGGLSFDEIAARLGVSPRTAQRLWERARLRLHQSLRAGDAA